MNTITRLSLHAWRPVENTGLNNAVPSIFSSTDEWRLCVNKLNRPAGDSGKLLYKTYPLLKSGRARSKQFALGDL